MATYVIGDIQGCYPHLRKLLRKIQFEHHNDQLILAGDMINRGSDSLATMMYILENQTSIRCVLGNHDLHFLAVANHCQKLGKNDTFSDILQSSNKQIIIDWLTKQPLVIYEADFDALIVHAGLPFNWSKQMALDYSQEVCNVLQSDAAHEFYTSMYGNQPDYWNDNLKGIDRLRFITNALTRIRYCYADGRLELKTKSPPGQQAIDLIPWFELENRLFTGNIVFGHWASLQGECAKPNLNAIDTGCIWGGKLTALRLDDGKRIQV